MRSRFTIIPVLQSLKADFAGIIAVTAKSISPASQINETDERVKAAAEIFYQKGANPRHIRACLSNVLMLNNTSVLTPGLILFAAQDFCATTDLNSAIYADLWAIEACSSKSFLPWTENLESYSFPEHLRDIVDVQTGNINQKVLTRRLEEFRPNANL